MLKDILQITEQCFLFILDIIDSKFFNKKADDIDGKKKVPVNVCVIDFVNKGIDYLHLNRIFRSDAVKNALPDYLKSQDLIPTVTMKLINPIRNKIFNYKDTINSINIEANSKTLINIHECDCANSPFKDSFHEHIVTGDLKLIKISKLWKLISKGPNYRKKSFLNFNKCLSSIKSTLNIFEEKLVTKYKLADNALENWKELIFEAVEDKINNLKQKIKPQKTRPFLQDQIVLNYLTEIHNKFVLVPVDKASKIVAIICKKFYVKRILKEVGILGPPSSTYNLVNRNPDEIITNNLELCNLYGLKTSEKHHSLLLMYWMPKMHYTPSKARFIVASSTCSNKPLSKIISTIFSKIFTQINNFHAKAHFHKNYNRFWVIQNSKPVIDRLSKLNKEKRAKEISTYDFSTLYTKLPHIDLVTVLYKLIEFVFNGGRKTADGNRKYITVQGSLCYFSRYKHGQNSYTINQVKRLTSHLITETFFMVGNCLFHQIIGIPMGIDPASFWANLYSYYYENLFMVRLIGTDKYRGFKFKNCFRFIDDECNLDDFSEFGFSFKEIYPDCLELKCEHKGSHATFLEIDITIEDGIFVYKLYDKRDNFPFEIVRMPDLSGNIPSHVFYGSIMSEILRIARATLRYNDFLPRVKKLFDRMLNQGANKINLMKQVTKVTNKHWNAFQSFDVTKDIILKNLSY